MYAKKKKLEREDGRCGEGVYLYITCNIVMELTKPPLSISAMKVKELDCNYRHVFVGMKRFFFFRKWRQNFAGKIFCGKEKVPLSHLLMIANSIHKPKFSLSIVGDKLRRVSKLIFSTLVFH